MPIEQKIKEIISDKTGVDESKIQNQSNLQADLGIDSLDMLEVIMDIENTFKITINSDNIEKIKTVQSLIDLASNQVLHRE